MSSKDTNTHWNQQHLTIKIGSQDLNLIKYEQSRNQFMAACKKCQIACPVQDKAPPTWMCNKCNIIYSYVHNNIHAQAQKQSIQLKDSVSTPAEQIECAITRSDLHATDNSIDKNYVPNYRRHYNVSRSITLNVCDIDSTSTATETTAFHSHNDKLKLKQYETTDSQYMLHRYCTETIAFHSHNDKLKLKQNETTDPQYMLHRFCQNMDANKPTLKLENLTVSTISTVHTQNQANSSHIQNQANSSHIQNQQVKISRQKSYKLLNSKWSASLEALSELSESQYYKSDNGNNTVLNPMKEVFGECINTKINDVYDHIVQAQQELQAAYLKGFTQGYSTGVQFQMSTYN